MREMKGVLVKLHRRGWTVIQENAHDPETGRVTMTGTVTGYGEHDWETHVEAGCPIVNTRVIPEDKILKWALHSPLIDPDLKGVRGVKVEQNSGGFGDSEMQFAEYLHPTFRAIAHLGNLQKVSVEEYLLLAKEYGAIVTYYKQ